MSLNPIVPNYGNNKGQVSNTQSQSGEQAFHDLAKSNGNSKELMDQAVSDRTRLTRTKRIGRSSKTKNSQMFLVGDDGNLEEEPVYRTIMVDGVIFTLRLLAVA